MSEKGVREADLLLMENRINKEQQQARHWQSNVIQRAVDKVDEISTENKLINNSMMNMSKEFSKLESKVDDWFQKLEDKFDKFIESADNRYADKQTVSSVLWVVRIIWTVVITTLTWAILKITGFIWK